jgi:hypothetical protein
MNSSDAIALLTALAVYAVVGYVNLFATENQIYHNINDPPLYDRGHRLIPIVSTTWANVGTGLIISYFVIRWGSQYPNVLTNYLWLVSLLFIGRVAMLSVTQLPPAMPGCSTMKKGDNLQFILGNNNFKWCLDYMYSGHTIHCVLVTLFTLYLSTHTLEKVLIVLAVLAELVLIVGSRMHYTSDVLVATLVSILVFFAWPGIGNVKTHIMSGGLYGLLMRNKKTNDLMH